MAASVYNIAKGNWMKATMDMDAASNVKARLCMTNTTADTDIDADTVGGITTLDETTDTSYTAQTLTTTSISISDAGDLASFLSDSPITFTLAGNGARDLQGILLVDYVDGGTGDIPIAFLDLQGQPISKTITTLNINIPGNGWCAITAP